MRAKSGLSGPVACAAHRATPNHVSCPLSTENGAMNLASRIFTQKEPVNRGVLRLRELPPAHHVRKSEFIHSTGLRDR